MKTVCDDKFFIENFDIEAIIENCKQSKEFIFSGYRPAHLVHEKYLTSGVHYYPNKEKLYFGESTLGYIRFITPTVYPKCLWVGKKLSFQEGNQIVGYATITRIFNNLLDSPEKIEYPLNLKK